VTGVIKQGQTATIYLIFHSILNTDFGTC